MLTPINHTQLLPLPLPLYNTPSTPNTTTIKPLSSEARKQFLENISQLFVPIQVPVKPNEILETSLENFRKSKAFTTLIACTTDALRTILSAASQSLSTAQTEEIQKRFGEMLSKMQVPQQNNPWFNLLSEFDQQSPTHYSPTETFHAYQSACSELQMIAHLVQSGTQGKLGIAPHEALKSINAFLQNLAADIAVCGAGSLLNIEALRKNLQQQLLPGDLGEQFSNQVEMIVQEHIRSLLAALYKRDPLGIHAINEIHRTKAVRSLISNTFNLPDISIAKDPHAQSFLDELNTEENTDLKALIVSSLDSTFETELTADHIAIDLANTYLDKIKDFLVSRNIDPLKIPSTSNAIEKAIEQFSSEFRLPPENYILDTPDRADYSRCITQSASLLGAWFLHKLFKDHASVRSRFQEITTHVTNSWEIPAKATNSAIKTAPIIQDLKVYQAGELIWTGNSNPLSSNSEPLLLEHLSNSWINTKLTQASINQKKLNVFFEALVNSINHALLSDPGSSNQNENACDIFKNPVFDSLGLSPLVNAPPHFLNTEDKVITMLHLCLSAQDNPDNNALTNILLPEAELVSCPETPYGLQQLLNNCSIARLSCTPSLATPDNSLALNLFRKMLKNHAIRPEAIKQEKSLLAWGMKHQDANILNLIIQAYKLERPKQAMADALKANFPLYPKRNVNNIFPNWLSKYEVKTTALCLASICGNTNLIKMLLEEGLDINAANQYGYSPLTYAAASNSSVMVGFLIQHGANVHGENTQHRKTNVPPILAAALTGNITNITKLVEAGANVNQASQGHKLTPLHIAYTDRDFKMIDKLYDLGATHGETKAILFDSAPLTQKRTPLEMVLYQLKHSKIGAEKKLGRTQHNKQSARVYVLHHIRNGMPFDLKPLVHGYPLPHALAYQNNREALTMMMKHFEKQPVEKSTQLNARSSNGTHRKTPLMVAAKQGNLECIEYLLSHQETDLLATDSKGRTALDIAKQFSKDTAAQLLQAHWPHPNSPIQGASGQTIQTGFGFRQRFRRHG